MSKNLIVNLMCHQLCEIQTVQEIRNQHKPQVKQFQPKDNTVVDEGESCVNSKSDTKNDQMNDKSSTIGY